MGDARPPPRRKAKIQGSAKLSENGSSSMKGAEGAKGKRIGLRTRALDLVKKHAPDHLDTAKKTKWVVELIEGVLAAQDAVMESAQAVHVSDMAASKQETAVAVAESMEAAARARQANEETAAVQQQLESAKAEVEAAKVALEQAEMSAVVAATECMNMQKVAQAGSQGDKKARRVLSLRAHHLKENLLKAKTDLRVHKAACRHQAYRIEVMNKEHEAAATAASQLTEQLAVQHLAAKQALKQSKSQSRLYQTKAMPESDATALIPAVQASTVGKAPRQQATALSPVASPARRTVINGSPKNKVLAAAETLQVQEKAGEAHSLCSLNAAGSHPARMAAWGDASVVFDTAHTFGSTKLPQHTAPVRHEEEDLSSASITCGFPSPGPTQALGLLSTKKIPS